MFSFMKEAFLLVLIKYYLEIHGLINHKPEQGFFLNGKNKPEKSVKMDMILV